VSKNVDFHVKFNSDVRGKMNYDEGDVDSVAKTDEILCDLQRTSSSNMLDGNGYEAMGTATTGGMNGPPSSGGQGMSGGEAMGEGCEGMGETWGPGIGPPPSGCERDGGSGQNG
jgi:hypothetical protein